MQTADSHPSTAATPDRLLGAFTHTHIGRAYVLSAVVHAGFILLLSVGYIRDTWVDPEGAKAREAAQKAKLIEAATPPAAAPEEPAAETKPAAPASAPASSPAAKPDSAKTDADILEERKDTPVGRAITDSANPAEVTPGGEGLPLTR
jgi:pyruvate/2-oxoglutarate dehydrogenase complex dihydrolipoamide acyltransferase (E2) component